MKRNFIHGFLCAAIFSIPTLSSAIETCPSIQDIKVKGAFDENGRLASGWQALTINEYPAEPDAILDFQLNVKHFYVATWSEDYHPTAQCHYRAGDVEVMLGKNIANEPDGNLWKWDKPGFSKQCFSEGVTQCLYK